jgi:RNA-binding protein
MFLHPSFTGSTWLHDRISSIRLFKYNMKLTTKQIAHLRGLAHALNPVVMIGNQGLTENVLKEIDLNLNAHELIKVQVAGDDREARKTIYNQISQATQSIAVHHIGKQLVFYRKSDTIKESAKIIIPKP